MKKQQLLAAVILVAVVAWMGLPIVSPDNAETVIEDSETRPTTVVALPEGGADSESPDVVTVRAERINSQIYIERIRVRGRTQAYRHVEVRAEEAGRIIGNPVKRGARINEGDVLCEIAVDNRDVNLQEAVSRREQAEFEYEGALDLQEQGLQSDIVVAQLRAALESSKAAVARAELSLEKTKIVAPFNGIVETRTVEVGDLLNIGAVCASILDDSPMLLVGLVPEQDVGALATGARVTGRLLSGEEVQGTVSYLARAADSISRSYRIEIEVDSRYENLREGVTVEILVNANEVIAHRIPSSSLTLDDTGKVGVKIIDRNNTVQFYNIEIIGDETNQLDPGIWVTGLRDTVTLVTLGQEIVFPGQIIEANFDWDK